MEQNVVIRYVSGTKGSAVEEIPIAGRQELVAGRAPSCDIRYDLDADSLVSRRHMKIEISDADELEFTAVDLHSRNGTFVNKTRLRQPSKLKPGDVVQLGSGGPEFVFDLDPRTLQKPGTNKTTAYNVLSHLEAPQSAPAPPPPARKRLRRWLVAAILVLLLATAAALLGPRAPQPSQLSQGAKSSWAYVTSRGAVLSRAALESGRSLYQKARVRFAGTRASQETAHSQAPAPVSTPISRPAGRVDLSSLANVEVRWILSDARSGRRVRQVYIANLPVGAAEESSPLIPGAGKSLPLFVLLDDNRLQPVLTESDENGARPIGGTYRDAGLRPSGNGARPADGKTATPWAFPYEWPADVKAGVVAKFDKHRKLINSAVIARRQFPKWRPADAPFILADTLSAASLR